MANFEAVVAAQFKQKTPTTTNPLNTSYRVRLSMLLTTIRTAPALSDFTPLQEHQEQTPSSFFDGKPVLHYFTAGAKAWIPKSQLGKLVFFPEGLSSDPAGPEGTALNGTVEENVEQKVDVYVSSQYVPQIPVPQVGASCRNA